MKDVAALENDNLSTGCLQVNMWMKWQIHYLINFDGKLFISSGFVF